MRPYEIIVDTKRLKTYGTNTIEGKQGDKDSRVVSAIITADGVPLDLTNKTVTFYAIKPDKTKIFNSTTIKKASDGEVEFKLTTQVLAIEGMVKGELVVFGADGYKLTSALFIIEVIKSINDESAIESQNEFTLLTDALTKLTTWDNQFETKYNGLEAEYAEDITSVKSQLADKANQSDLNDTNNKVSIKVSKSYVDEQISSIGSATPKGVYPTLAALEEAFPSGASGVYVVAADGNWYYWEGSKWAVGGPYQGTMTPDAAISVPKLSDSFFEEVYIPYRMGTVGGDGNPGSSETSIRNNTPFKASKQMRIIADDTVYFRVHYYSDNNYFPNASFANSGTRSGEYSFEYGDCYVRVLVWNKDSSFDSLESLASKVSVQYVSPVLLEKSITNDLLDDGAVALSKLNDDLFDEIDIGDHFVMGGLDATGVNVNSTTRIRSINSFYASKHMRLVLEEGVRVYVVYYSDTSTPSDRGVFEWATPWQSGEYIFEQNGYARLVVSYSTESNFDSLESLVSKVSLHGLMYSIHGHERLGDPYEHFDRGTVISLDDNVGTIRELERSLGNNGFSFVFFTDLHYNKGFYQRFSKALGYLDEKLKIDVILNGGDTVWNVYVSSQLDSFYEELKKYNLHSKMMNTVGNHDIYEIADVGAGMSDIYHDFIKGFNQDIVLIEDHEHEGHYYYDDDFNKVRYVNLNSHWQYEDVYCNYSERGIKWFFEKALDIPDGWGLIVFSHEPPEVADGIYSEQKIIHSKVVLDALDLVNSKSSGTLTDGWGNIHTVDFTERDNYVVAFLCGHTHKDEMDTYKSVKIVITTNTRRGQDGNSYNEMRFDYLVVDKVNRKCDMIRIGSGESRSFTF